MIEMGEKFEDKNAEPEVISNLISVSVPKYFHLRRQSVYLRNKYSNGL